MVGMDETSSESCMYLANRGADPANRGTWNSKVSSKVNSAGTACNGRPDASNEEITHMLQEVAGFLYPTIWAAKTDSLIG